MARVPVVKVPVAEVPVVKVVAGPSLTPADRVTLVRAALVAVVTALVVAGGPAAALVAVASVALVLDGVDGYVARRTGTESARGARFDMEVDAFLVLVLSFHVAAAVGWWVPAIGVMRYAFGVAALAAPWLRGDLPPSFARKTVAAAQGIALVVAAAGVLPHAVGGALVTSALAALIWSFGRDIGRLWRRRAPRVPAAARPRRARPRTAPARTAGTSVEKGMEGDDGPHGTRVLAPLAR